MIPWHYVFLYNLFAWCPAYFAGLQFTHLDKGPMQKFSMNPEFMKQWPVSLWILLIGLVLLLLGIFTYMLIVYYMCGFLWWYIIFFVVIALGFILPTVILRKSHHIHVHHYTIGMVLISLIGYQSIPAALIHGFCNGMMIEGGCRWGYDPIWIRHKPAEQPPN
jgi:hypothetical protein